jgi:4-amino-4-deoxy-L-arabinose transferase-like glycosyltransferase
MKLFHDWSSIILSVILILAMSVRLLGINYGLPYVFYPDEALIVNHAMAFGTGDLNPHFFGYPSLYMYLLFVVYGITYATGRLLGFFGSPNDFIHLFFTDVTIFYLPGRLIAAFSGVATVWMVYKLGRRAYNLQVGLISAAMLSFSVLHVTFSHSIKTHVPAGLLVIIALYFAWSIYDGQNSWRRYLLAGATAGLAGSTIYHAGFVLVSIGVAHLLHSKKRPAFRLADLKLAGAALSSFGGFVLTTPYSILDWPTFFSDLTSTAAVVYYGNFWVRGTFYHFTSLLSSFGQPLGAVVLLGLGYALLRHRPADLILASQPIFVGLFLMLFPVKEAHNMLIAFPALSLLAASLVADAIKWLFQRGIRLQQAAAAVTTGLLVLMPAKQSFQSSYRRSLPDTRFLAKTWVEENISLGSKIVMDSGKYYLEAFGPPLPPSRWTLEQLINRGKATNSGNVARREGARRVAYSGEATYFQLQLNALGNQPGYDIIRILHGVGSPDALSLKQYVEQGVQYAIVSSYATVAPGYSNHKHFYESLREQGTLIKEFRPSEKIGGPTLLIYKLR